MKRLALILTVLALPFVLCGQERLRDQMLHIYELYGMNFVYDEAIDIDSPSNADISKAGSLEDALEKLAYGNGLIFETNKKFIVLKKADKVRDYIIFLEEQRDTLSESRITVATDRDRNTTQTGLMKIDSRKFKRGFAFMELSRCDKDASDDAGSQCWNGTDVRAVCPRRHRHGQPVSS